MDCDYNGTVIFVTIYVLSPHFCTLVYVCSLDFGIVLCIFVMTRFLPSIEAGMQLGDDELLPLLVCQVLHNVMRTSSSQHLKEVMWSATSIYHYDF